MSIHFDPMTLYEFKFFKLVIFHIHLDITKKWYVNWVIHQNIPTALSMVHLVSAILWMYNLLILYFVCTYPKYTVQYESLKNA